ncbi:MAG: CPBP family intramembrane metalloprotease [Acidobacteriales bacterium]|nr:CPBP family intramembrane metalloprotease [Terriglobales bacterium]
MRNVPTPLLLAALPAFLVEITLYFLTMSGRTRAWLDRFSSGRVAIGLAASGLATYSLYSLPLGSFRWESLALLALFASLVLAWYLVLPRRWYADVGFLALMAGVVLSKVFARIYLGPHEDLPGSTLGQVMWIRLGVVAALRFRGMEGVGLGLLPTSREWAVGGLQYLYFIPIGVVLSFALKFKAFRWNNLPWWLIILTFLAMLWVVGLSEEFFFRGLLLQWVRAWTGRGTLALVATSLLFGAVHLPFGAFPNWKFALIAAIAGWFYGRAYLKTGSIRAAMVAHALTNVTWKAFFA